MAFNIDITFSLHVGTVFGILHFFWCTTLHMYRNTQIVIECTKFTISLLFANGLAVNGASMLVSESITSGLSSLYNSIVTKRISWILPSVLVQHAASVKSLQESPKKRQQTSV